MRRADVAAAARGWVGTPYRHQASMKAVGCDCLGLVRGVWREVLGAEPELVPPYSPDWAEAARRETLLEAAARNFIPAEGVEAGRLLVFRWRRGMPAKHVGVAVSATRFVHAYDSAGRAVEGDLAPMWRRRLVATFDFPGVTD
ncbi:NlpC/P60 family protein [Acuticoccus yangtzensis]|uniref:NlpC/P60 family protein n=1 Tax=Acuticoccus yangtzensis TaxID=1443441 RepID=UPI000949AF83|nr:NlpC/P60 family protein [Acuticoccus yangtzensis]